MAIPGFSLPEAQHSSAASPVRQLRALLTPPPSDAAALRALAQALAATNVLAELHAASSSGAADGAAHDEESATAASAALTRLATLTSSQLAAAPYAGAPLAVQQLLADSGSAHAEPWAHAAVAALLALSENGPQAATRRALTGASGVTSLLALAAQLLGEQAHADERPAYRRAVVAPNAPRHALALVALAERAADSSTELVIPVCDALNASLQHHASMYRPHGPRLHAVVVTLLYNRCVRGRAQESAARLAAALHRTGAAGKGKGTQAGAPAELWAAGIAAPLAAARISAAALSSTFAATQPLAVPRDPGLFDVLPADEAEAVPIALSRLELLLGSPTSRGVLPIYLAQASAGRVTLPLSSLLALCSDILSLGASPEARQPPPDGSLLALQTAVLPRAQEAALRLLAALLTSATREASTPHAPGIISTLVGLIEQPALSARTRFAATRTLALALGRGVVGAGIPAAALPLDPASPLVLSTARSMLLLLARFVTHAAVQHAEPSAATARKKRKYESDAVNLGAAGNTGLVALSPDEEATGRAALDVMTALAPLLASDLTPAHHSLRHTHALLLLSLATLSVGAPQQHELAVHTLSALASLVVEADGALLALLLARTVLVLNAARNHARADVQRAGAALQGAVEMVLDPRLPPRIGLAHDELPAEWAGEGSVRVELPADGTRKALDLLGIPDASSLAEAAAPAASDSLAAAMREPSSLPSPARLSSPVRQQPPAEHGIEPTKPVRAHTPRIGSPAASPERRSGDAAGSPARSIFAHSQGSPRQAPLDAPTGGDRVASPLGPRALAAPPAPVVVHQQTTTTVQIEPDQDDDEEMPEIDLRDSDEESD